MKTRLLCLGNSQILMLPKKLLQQYCLAGEVSLQPTLEGLLIRAVAKPPHHNWAAQMQVALAAGQELEGELL